MSDDRLLKRVLFGIMDGSDRRERPRRRRTDDVEGWSNDDLHTLSMKETDGTDWRQMVMRLTSTSTEPMELDDDDDDDDDSSKVSYAVS